MSDPAERATLDSARFVNAIEQIADAWAIPGGVVAVSDRHGLVCEHAFGLADRERQRATTTDHLFEIGSISKIMTATIVLELVERGMLRFDDPISEILDGLPHSLAHPSVTIERLLKHSAGLVSGVDAVPDQLAQVAGFTGGRSSAEPGEFFHYSNLGFILLGLAVERRTGRPLGELVREQIFARIGAEDSIPVVRFDDRARLACGYQPLYEDRPWLPGDDLASAPFLEVDGADGSIAMTGRDLAVFGRMLLNGGVADNGHVVLSTASFTALTTRLAVDGEDLLGLHGIPSSDQTNYGLGINVERRGQSRLFSHGGGMVGFASFLLVDPDAGVSVAVLTNANGDGPIAEAIARTVAALQLNPVDSGPGSLSPAIWGDFATSVEVGTDSATGATRPRLLEPEMVGTFESDGDRLEVSIDIRTNSGVQPIVRFGADSAALEWDWGPRALTRLPALRAFPLQFDGTNWSWGPRVFRPVRDTSLREFVSDVASSTDWMRPFCGHFRSYIPWFTNFRTVIRHGDLVLIASPGVEAPGEDIVLVSVGDSTFRMGSDPRLPETLTFGPVINGLAHWADRDGCRYSRSFTR
jgi:D-alanyl-D-alanine carboxypeptidase